jgi:segregation and condensation protein A
MTGAFRVSLPRYEGPLDLLWDLIRREGWPLTDLPLASLTRQFLAYLAQAQPLDLARSIAWADWAARLIQWKSAALLPADPALPSAPDRLADELRRELEEWQRGKREEALQRLGERQREAERAFSQPTMEAIRQELWPEEPGLRRSPRCGAKRRPCATSFTSAGRRGRTRNTGRSPSRPRR